MKKLLLEEIYLISFQERAAKKVSFHPQRTIIQGNNSTGKSCLIKSIYKTFGAKPLLNESWKKSQVDSLIKFKLDNKSYYIMSYGCKYYLYDQNKKLIKSFVSVTNELTPFFAELFNFKIQLLNRSAQVVYMPPAYLFLPFYIDQDKSWQSNWSSFEDMSQFNFWKSDLAEYHTGIKPSEYYSAKAEIKKVKNDIKETKNKKKVLDGVLLDMNKQLLEIQFDIDINNFKKETDLLIQECQDLNKEQSKYRYKLSEKYQIRKNLEKQKFIVEKVLKQKRKAIDFADKIPDEVQCPTCSAYYKNSFSERFSIAQDEENLDELLQKINLELIQNNNEIKKNEDALSENHKNLIKIEKILNYRKEHIVLSDVLKSEGKKEMKLILKSKIDEKKELLVKMGMDLIELEKILKTFSDKNRIKAIKSFYHRLFSQFLLELDVHSFNSEDIKKIDLSAKDSGSSLPRFLLAYYFAILHVMKEYSSSVYCPLIIDSPNQQAQDNENLPRIYNFINKNQPADSQLILGVEDDKFIKKSHNDQSIVRLGDKNHLLQKDDFDSVYKIIKLFIDEGVHKTETSLF